MIQFNTIPASIRKPGVYMEFNTSLAVRTLPTNAQRVCFVVPLTKTGSDAALPLVPVQVYDDATAGTLFGEVAQAMTKAAITANPYIDLSLIGIAVTDDAEPNIKPALDVLAGGEYAIVVSTWMSQVALTALRTHINTITDAINQKSCIGVAAVTSTLSASTTLATALNSGAISIALLPGTASPLTDVAAAYAAVMAGEEDPARPLNTLPLTGIAPPPITARLMRGEQETALANGVTPLEVGPGEVVQIVRAISTYTKNPTGATDVALLDITTMRTLYYLRKACRDRIRLRFPRDKLAKTTPTKVRSELLDVLKKCEELEILESVDDYADKLVVERSLQDANRLNAAIPADVVNGLHVFAARIDLLL